MFLSLKNVATIGKKQGENMFKKLFDYGYERNIIEAIGFYIAYFIIVVIGASLFTAIVERMFRIFGVVMSYGASASAGNLIAIVTTIILVIVVVKEKKAFKHFGFILLGATAAILSYYGGAVVGLIPIAYLTTLSIYSKDEEKKYSNIQPIWQLILLTLFTLGFYQIYWFYRNWKQLKEQNNLIISPGWRTAGLFVPILGLLLIYDQFKMIKEAATKAKIKKIFSPGWMTFLFVVLSYSSQATWIFPLGCIVLVFIQLTLNAYWESQQPNMEIRKTLSIGE
ncbi:MAG: hypothetical protein ABIH56_03455, partial [Candidatus Margulisiibacteriota bacterium]